MSKDWLDKLAQIIDTADRVRKGAEKFKGMALKVQSATEKWNARRLLKQCPLCGGEPAEGSPFCVNDLGKLAAFGLRNLDADAVRDFFGKRG